EAALLRSKHLFDSLRSRATILDAALASKRASAGAQLNSATDLLIGILVAGLVLLVLAGVGMRRSLRRWVLSPLGQLGSDARVVAAGEVAHTIPPTGPPEFQRLAGDVEAMRERIVDELEQVGAARADLADRNRDLARSNVELEQFAYVASHDLQEPLRKVTSFVQLLQQRYEGELDERADQFIGFAVDGAKRMQVLINDLLAFSRVGRNTERFVRVDLTAVIDISMANLASAIEESGARIESGTMPTVMGDPGLLAALWQNLIANSIKFRADRPPVVTITTAASNAPISPGPGDLPDRAAGGTSGAPLWTFCVTDNGIGIEPRFAEKIFVIFQRLHSRESYEGTGIGLALCKKIVEFHGGTIWLDLDHRPGTRLCFTLPVAPPPDR
ncbi:MAG TPA: ATP-binding protein, partial [Acidimicrobiales bacterium]|nr:ATP-binding protein [Acidimicrobiales bacterium]